MFDVHDDKEVLIAEIDSLRDYIRTQASEIAEIKNTEIFLFNEMRRREREIEMIYSSFTWKIGRLVLGPALLLRSIFRRFSGV